MKLSLILAFMVPYSLFCRTWIIGPGADFPTLDAAEASIEPGDTLLLLSFVFSNGTQFLDLVHGTETNPVVIQAQVTHGAVFRGGTEAIHLTDCSYIELRGLVFEQQTGNGVNIDDGGSYNTPSHHITIDQCLFRDMAGTGNNDLLKLSGLDHFLIRRCTFQNGSAGGSGIDMVGCHHGIIEDNLLENAGSSGIQAKGGTQFIRIQRNILRDMPQRALNLGGSTGLEFFRPPLPDPIVNAFEAADLEVFSNLFFGSWAPIAYVGCIRVKVIHNTFIHPQNWVIRILQETTVSGFLPCMDNEFRNNIVTLSADITEVNVGPNTNPSSFIFTNNLWHNQSNNSWTPGLPVVDTNQIIANPQFTDLQNELLTLEASSPAIRTGKKLPQPTHDFVQHSFYDPPSRGAYEGNQMITGAPYHIRHDCIIMGPNPSSNSVTLDGDFESASIQILASNGLLVQDLSESPTPVVIDLDLLPAGLYFIRITSTRHALLSVQRILKM